MKAVHYRRPIGTDEARLPMGVYVRYLLASEELEGGPKRATDPNWSLEIYELDRCKVSKGQPVLYYLKKGP